MDKEPMTKTGYEQITGELSHLKSVERPATLIAIEEARQLGDLKENAEYHAAREKLKIIDAKIAELNDTITKAIIIDPATLPHDRVSFGSTVLMIDVASGEEITYTIVGSTESDPTNGLISFNSPLAKQLLGKVEGDELKATLPGGKKEFEIERVYYKEVK
ncbi:transcription elongation factor GreA [Arcobacter sp. FWKO B]|uniref:transcription elongation factor GreA n=1 Tax=Arcobacter sp. FWKO B TaxID=2593672 RepID=UPI0018A45401|nr:transcription elongation factor GreA [Arcobacter sp. FWKO B]QOG13098.1 transcription elongation factor GreA [Arcobacter sp. FWKO B]